KLNEAKYELELVNVNVVKMTSISKTQMKITISNPNGGNVTRVQFPTWSMTNGQDDIKWLEGTRDAGGSWSVIVDSKEFKHGGAFKTDIYGTVDGKLQKLNEAKYELELVNVNVVKMTSISKTQMKITISNPNGGNVTRVQFPTWSTTNGQDDIKWLEGTRNTDGSWSVVVNSSEYKHAGAFKTDIYGTVNGKMQKLGDANYTLEAPTENTVETKSISSTKMQVTIFNPNGGNVTRVQFPTWSTTNGQDDIKWLEGTRNSNGSWSVVVNSSEYKHGGGFKTDIYGTVNGKMQKLGDANYTLEAPAENTVETKSISNTKMQVTIFNPNGGNVTRVQFPTWSTTNGQDDIKWLEGTRNSNGSWSVIVNSIDFKHGGAFKTDIYGTVNGKLQYLSGANYTLQQDEVAIRLSKRPYYYSQLDGRWSNRQYGMSTLGPSGCVPTSMAMVLKGHFGINVTPIDTANRIYSFGGFNQQYFGASGPDFVKGMNSYGKQVVVMNSLAELNDYLAKGYPVVMYVNVGIGHAIVGHGYSNGKTTIYDPYGQKFYSGQVSTSQLWNNPSEDYVDWTAGRPFFAVK
ncbi:GBS Bsp-like repeat-containing protein, partial [Enterococcus sp. LJL99]